MAHLFTMVQNKNCFIMQIVLLKQFYHICRFNNKIKNFRSYHVCLKFILSFILDSCNQILVIHRVSDPNQSDLLDQDWEIFDRILSCTNQEQLPIFFLSQLDEIMKKFKIWESGPPLCIVPQVFHFLELVT